MFRYIMHPNRVVQITANLSTNVFFIIYR